MPRLDGDDVTEKSAASNHQHSLIFKIPDKLQSFIHSPVVSSFDLVPFQGDSDFDLISFLRGQHIPYGIVIKTIKSKTSSFPSS